MIPHCPPKMQSVFFRIFRKMRALGLKIEKTTRYGSAPRLFGWIFPPPGLIMEAKGRRIRMIREAKAEDCAAVHALAEALEGCTLDGAAFREIYLRQRSSPAWRCLVFETAGETVGFINMRIRRSSTTPGAWRRSWSSPCGTTSAAAGSAAGFSRPPARRLGPRAAGTSKWPATARGRRHTALRALRHGKHAFSLHAAACAVAGKAVARSKYILGEAFV